MSTRLPASARREQLLAIGLEVFARQGFHGTSMNDVADAAGVTKPVLYQHFASKRELYLALLEEVGRQLLDAIAKATAGAARRQGPDRGRVHRLLPVGGRRPRRLPAAVRQRRPSRRGVRRGRPPGRGGHRRGHRAADRRRHRRLAPAHAGPRPRGAGRGGEPAARGVGPVLRRRADGPPGGRPGLGRAAGVRRVPTAPA